MSAVHQEPKDEAHVVGVSDAGPARGVAPYAVFVLAMLLSAYTINWFDRNLLIISMEAIKRDLALSDTSLGLVTGIAFSGVYTVAGIMLARRSDVGSRRSVIAGGLALWSVATAFCGMARTAGMLFVGRFFVGLGESACSPPAHSLIADYFKPGQRATALAVYGLGEYLGLGLGLGVGGWLIDQFGWRAAFSVAALPGLALALFFRLTVREPARGRSAKGAAEDRHYPVGEVVRFMLARRSFVAYVIGTGLFVFAGDSTDIWGATFLIRLHGYSDADVGETIGLLGSIAGVVGTLFFAILADRLSIRDSRWYLWVAAGGGAVMLPLSLLFLYTDGPAVFVYYFLATFFGASYMAPTLAITQRLMPPRMRAVSSAVILFSFNILGIALGNLATGLLSDGLEPRYGVEALRYALAATLLAGVVGFVLTLYGAHKLPGDLRATGTTD
jgi:MFS family permease